MCENKRYIFFSSLKNFRDYDIVQLSKLLQLSGLQNSANLAKIRYQCIQALRILQRFCTSLPDFDIFELCKISEIIFFHSSSQRHLNLNVKTKSDQKNHLLLIKRRSPGSHSVKSEEATYKLCRREDD
ncbi:hypothetical protein BpHYR1_027379 [Brachionus plicatilis]|uniref:Uncharacterized protein n=1 Tax=Brachionus plicatilis TaxID=10195 RepID=A0A3M7RP19_BRAPC|nr:hypothetical protein BpHYR1_027379 [Brachionus plicatilis]